MTTDGPFPRPARPCARPRAWRGSLLVLALLAQALPALSGIVAAQDTAPPSPESAAAPRIAGLIREPRLREISGIAASRRHAGLLWVHNDSGYPAQVHAIDTQGRHRATLDIDGVAARDFEDIAAFVLDGVAYLLIADTGDNGGRRSEVELVVLAEPERLEDAQVAPAWVQRLRWPDGPRDVEAVAVDTEAEQVLFITKKRVPAELLVAPLRARTGVIEARRVGSLSGIEQPSPAELAGNPRFGRYRAQITGADLSADGRMLAVLNYRRAYLYRRDVGEGWAQALARPGQPLQFGWLAQAEAIAFDTSGRSLWISSERLPAPLIELPLPPPER